LASVEVDLRQVKAQVASSHASSHAVSSLDNPVRQNNEVEDDGSEVFADATDGVGTMEFTTEKTSAYFGMPSLVCPTWSIQLS
jgi:hypothetical protein